MPALLVPALRDGGVYGTYGMDDFGQLAVPLAAPRGRVTLHPCSYDEGETHQRVSAWVLQGHLTTDLWYDINAPYALAKITDAFAAVRARTSPKALVKMVGGC